MCENTLPLVVAKGKIKDTPRFIPKDVFTALLITY